MFEEKIKGDMIIIYLTIGLLLCGIIITTIQIRIAKKREQNQILEMFKDIPNI
jgi:hypothetical protein